MFCRAYSGCGIAAGEGDRRRKGDLSDPRKDTAVRVYCRSGNRSKTAAGKLADLGYTEIYEFGGINTWSYEVEQTE